MSLADALERAAGALPAQADAIRPANGDAHRLLESTDPAGAAAVLAWLLDQESAESHELLEVWRECERVLLPNGKLCINTPILPIPKAVMPDQHTRHLKNLNNDIEATILTQLSLERFSLYIWQKQTTEKMFGSYPHPPNIFEQNTVEFINVLVKPR